MNGPSSQPDSHPNWPNSTWIPTQTADLCDEPGAAPEAPTHPQRQPQATELSTEAQLWMTRLPTHCRPLFTARRHPHIVNRLQELWATPEALPAHFRELMMSSRRGRKGFAFEVLSELADLQNLFEATQKG